MVWSRHIKVLKVFARGREDVRGTIINTTLHYRHHFHPLMFVLSISALCSHSIFSLSLSRFVLSSLLYLCDFMSFAAEEQTGTCEFMGVYTYSNQTLDSLKTYNLFEQFDNFLEMIIFRMTICGWYAGSEVTERMRGK